METKYDTTSTTMGETCEIIYSQKGNHKLRIRGYLMVKERNRNDIFYWCCVKNKSINCKGRVTTILINQQHYVKKFVNHNHEPTEDVKILNSNIKIEAETENNQDSFRFSPRSSDVTGESIPACMELKYVPLCTIETKEDCPVVTDVGAPQTPHLSTNVTYIKSICNILECEMLQMPEDVVEECKDEIMELIMRNRRKVKERKEIDVKRDSTVYST